MAQRELYSAIYWRSYTAADSAAGNVSLAYSGRLPRRILARGTGVLQLLNPNGAEAPLDVVENEVHDVQPSAVVLGNQVPFVAYW